MSLVTNSSGLAQQMLATVRGVGLVSDAEPVLLAPDVTAPDVALSVRQAMAGDCDSVLCAIVRVFDGGTDAVQNALADVAATATKPVIGVFLGFRSAPEVEEEPDTWGGLPRFDGPVGAIHALAAVSAYAHWRQRDPGAVPMLENDTDRAKRLVNGVLTRQPDGRELTDAETSELLSAYGIELVPRYRVDSVDHAIEVAERLGWNVVLKATAEAVRGRPDLASARRDLDRPEEMAEAWNDLTLLVRSLGLDDENGPSLAEPVVQAMAPPGVALVITSREDAAFGPIISLGLDGIPSELLGDTVYRVPPLTTVDAAAMVRDLRAAPTLFGQHRPSRGGCGGDRESPAPGCSARRRPAAARIPRLEAVYRGASGSRGPWCPGLHRAHGRPPRSLSQNAVAPLKLWDGGRPGLENADEREQHNKMPS